MHKLKIIMYKYVTEKWISTYYWNEEMYCTLKVLFEIECREFKQIWKFYLGKSLDSCLSVVRILHRRLVFDLFSTQEWVLAIWVLIGTFLVLGLKHRSETESAN